MTTQVVLAPFHTYKVLLHLTDTVIGDRSPMNISVKVVSQAADTPVTCSRRNVDGGWTADGRGANRNRWSALETGLGYTGFPDFRRYWPHPGIKVRQYI
jgi:hypothetical protein